MPLQDPIGFPLPETWRRFFSLLGPWVLSSPVYGSTSTPVTNNSNVLAATGLTASMTPTSKSSRVLILVAQSGVQKDTGDTGVRLELQRDGAAISTLADNAGSTGSAARNNVGSVVTAFIETPRSVSRLVYRTMFASKANIAAAKVQVGGETSTMVLVELAGA